MKDKRAIRANTPHKRVSSTVCLFQDVPCSACVLRVHVRDKRKVNAGVEDCGVLRDLS